jgi:uncharacterized membrane protein (DUF373 family)
MIPDINKIFVRAVIIVLLVLMAVVVLFSVVELIRVIVIGLFHPPNPVPFLEQGELLEVFGLFLLVLIGIELMEAIRMYIVENVIHVEIVLVLAIIAIARKVIILDPKSIDSASMLGIAAILIALTAGYFMLKKAGLRAPKI